MTFDIDANGIVHVGAKDLGTGKQQRSPRSRLRPDRGGDPADDRRHPGVRGDDKKKKELADLRNNADGLIYTTEKSLEEYASLLSAQDSDEIQADLRGAQVAC